MSSSQHWREATFVDLICRLRQERSCFRFVRELHQLRIFECPNEMGIVNSEILNAMEGDGGGEGLYRRGITVEDPFSQSTASCFHGALL